jgi:hypothetical protein
MPKASLHYPKGRWVIGKAHFGTLQPPKEKKGLEFKPIGVQVKLVSTLYQWVWLGVRGWVFGDGWIKTKLGFRA